MIKNLSDKESLLKLKLTALKEEVAAQANTFDQIDSKTGVALGFMFVAAGQVLAAVFLLATNQSHYTVRHPCFSNCVFVFANASALLAVLFGVAARWPRSFTHGVDFENINCNSLMETLEDLVTQYQDITQDNQDTNDIKHKWARPTYLCVGLSLIFYLVLTVILYFH
ncbi:MAG TPA: hypothetical protein VGG59_11865 [Acidobacteriaceae bacterium]